MSNTPRPTDMQASLSFTEEAGPRAELVGAAVTVVFMLAGNAHVTFQSRRTDTRFTYRVQAAIFARKPQRDGGPSHFVSVLTGPDNYTYLGCVYRRQIYAHGKKSRIAKDAPSAVAFAWVWGHLSAGKMHPELAIYHEGRCGKCGRRLTTPESIATGLGPVCGGRE